jgi:hypothetical protein
MYVQIIAFQIVVPSYILLKKKLCYRDIGEKKDVTRNENRGVDITKHRFYISWAL